MLLQHWKKLLDQWRQGLGYLWAWIDIRISKSFAIQYQDYEGTGLENLDYLNSDMDHGNVYLSSIIDEI